LKQKQQKQKKERKSKQERRRKHKMKAENSGESYIVVMLAQDTDRQCRKWSDT
jgi:hypothetical protein